MYEKASTLPYRGMGGASDRGYGHEEGPGEQNGEGADIRERIVSPRSLKSRTSVMECRRDAEYPTGHRAYLLGVGRTSAVSLIFGWRKCPMLEKGWDPVGSRPS